MEFNRRVGIKDAILKVRTILPEDLYGSEDQVAKVGAKFESFTLPLANGSSFVLNDVLKRGPVIVNFIKGTWCPYCQLHLKGLRDWQEKVVARNKQTSTTILIISNEPMAVIRKWLKNNPMPYLFASDEIALVAKLFGVTLSPQEFLKPATFLIDTDGTIRMAYAGRRKAMQLDRLSAPASLGSTSAAPDETKT